MIEEFILVEVAVVDFRSWEFGGFEGKTIKIKPLRVF